MKADKIELDQKILDGLESDVFEEFYSSNDSISDFEEDEDKPKKGGTEIKRRKKKKKKVQKDKRTTLSKSKMNLRQILAEEEKKGRDPRTLGFDDIVAPAPKTWNAPKICKVCFSPGNYSCPRCRDYYCSEFCHTKHKEFICAHIEYNYFY